MKKSDAIKISLAFLTVCALNAQPLLRRKPKPTPLPRPTPDNITFAWDISIGSSGYVLIYGPANVDMTEKDVGNVTTTEIPDSQIGNGTTYFLVEAYNATGNRSDPSNEVSVVK